MTFKKVANAHKADINGNTISIDPTDTTVKGPFLSIKVSLIETGTARELASLREWIKRDRTLRKHRVDHGFKTIDGTMGSIGDYLTVATTSGAAGFIARELCRAIIAWLKNQRSNITVRLTGKATIEINSSQVKQGSVEEILNSLGPYLDSEDK